MALSPVAAARVLRQDRVAALCLFVGVPALAWLLAGVSGSAGLPRTDDWAFARVAYSLHDAGALHLIGWGQMTLVGLVAWAQPWLAVFGDHMAVLDLSAGVLVAGGLAGAYLLARKVLRPSHALVAVASVALFPGFLRDAGTFMTDGPAFGVQVLCLLAGARALASDQRAAGPWLWVSTAVGIFGFSIRELAVAAPVAVLVAATVRARRLPRAQALVLTAAFLAMWGWHESLPGTQPWTGFPGALTAAAFVVSAGVTVGLGLVPALVWSAPRWWPARHRVGRTGGMLAAAALCVIPPLYAAHFHSPVYWFTGDYLARNGVNGDKITLGTRPALFPSPIWLALEVVAVAAFVVVAGLLVEAAVLRVARLRAGAARATAGRADSATPVLLGWFVALSAFGLVAAACFNGVVFDRYVWPVVFAGSVLVLRGPVRTSTVPVVRPSAASRSRARIGVWSGALATTAVAMVALSVTANSDAFDAARWEAAQSLVGQGVPAPAIDAGFEWVGSHSSTDAHVSKAIRGSLRSWWVNMLGLPTPCAVVASSPVDLAGFTRVGSRSWRVLLVAGHGELVVYRRSGAGCAGASSQ